MPSHLKAPPLLHTSLYLSVNKENPHNCPFLCQTVHPPLLTKGVIIQQSPVDHQLQAARAQARPSLATKLSFQPIREAVIKKNQNVNFFQIGLDPPLEM